MDAIKDDKVSKCRDRNTNWHSHCNHYAELYFSCQGIKSEESKHVTRLKELGCAFISLLEILKERMEFMTGSLQTSFS